MKIALVVVVFFSILCVGLTIWYFIPTYSPSFVNHSTTSNTGSFGPYFFTSDDGLKSFNSSVSEWFSEQNFEPDVVDTYFEILREGGCNTVTANWEQDGLLLCKRFNAENRIFIFIPVCFASERKNQRIGYRFYFSGTCEEVNKYVRDFESLEREFFRNFPMGDKIY